MPFELIRNDITLVKADAIVNSANPEPVVGRGTDSSIYNAAGYEKLLAERKKIGAISPGEAAVTKAFDLKAKFIIHTVGPVWTDGEHGELETLASCYRKCMRLAEQLGCTSIAFPLISTGVYGFPKDKALEIALREIETFLMDTEDFNVILVVYDRSSYEISSSLNFNVRSFISDRMVESKASDYINEKAASSYQRRESFRPSSSLLFPQHKKQEKADYMEEAAMPDVPVSSAMPLGSISSEFSVEDVLRKKSETFQEKLLSLIDERGMSDPEVYKKANMDRKLFSKIRSNPDYVPKQRTVFALAVSLKLDYPETADLLARAGYAFSPANATDLIIEYCIRHEIFNIMDINAILFEYDQSLL
ncbi:MAG: macro domain-containing protein [Solobacterium sp.]|nr:macro domain-containing protein [Solobacterium sp.]